MSFHIPRDLVSGDSKRLLLALIVVAIVIKVGMTLVVIPQVNNLFPGRYDICCFVDLYDLIAANLVQGNGYRVFPDTSETLIREPGYVLLLAGIFSLFGRSLLAAQIVNVLLSLATAYVVLRLAQKIVNEKTAHLIAVLVFLFYPAVMLAETRGGLETFLAFWTAVFAFSFYRALESDTLRDYAIMGILLGVLLLVRGTAILFPLFILGYLVWINRRRHRTKIVLINFLVMVSLTCITYSPWVLRNYSVSGKFVPLSTAKGVAAYQGLYLNKNILSTKDSRILLVEATKEQSALAQEAGFRFKEAFWQQFYSTNDEIGFDKLLLDRVIREYRNSPVLFVRGCLFGFFGFWFYGGKVAILLNMIVGIPLLSLAVIGAYMGYKNRLNIGPMLVIIGAFVVVHVPILGRARYHIPLVPFLAILASLALSHYSRRDRHDEKGALVYSCADREVL
jgi:4-amino-4-deoxy-L-arabinose transferase-like glycosyltransferase